MKRSSDYKFKVNIFILTLISYFIFMVVVIGLFARAASLKSEDVADACRPEYETLIKSETGRVTDKGGESIIELYGTYRDKSLYARKINLKIKDKESGKLIFTINPKQDSGIQPSFVLADFTGSGTQQIFLSSNSGGSRGFGYYYVFDVSGGEVKTIFDFEQINNPYSARFEDNYKLKISDSANNRSYCVDIRSMRNKDYLDAIYNSDGTLKAPQEATVWDISNVFPYYNGSLLRWQLETFNPVSGLYHADGYGNIINLLSYTKEGFNSYFESFAVS